MSAGELDILDSFLNEAVAEAAEKKELSKLKTRVRTGVLEVGDIERMKAWENANVWKKVANVALFDVRACECGFEHSLFVGLFLEQHSRHASMSNAKRYEKVDSAELDLPNKVAKRFGYMDMCDLCMKEKGFDPDQSIDWDV